MPSLTTLFHSHYLRADITEYVLASSCCVDEVEGVADGCSDRMWWWRPLGFLFDSPGSKSMYS